MIHISRRIFLSAAALVIPGGAWASWGSNEEAAQKGQIGNWVWSATSSTMTVTNAAEGMLCFARTVWSNYGRTVLVLYHYLAVKQQLGQASGLLFDDTPMRLHVGELLPAPPRSSGAFRLVCVQDIPSPDMFVKRPVRQITYDLADREGRITRVQVDGRDLLAALQQALGMQYAIRKELGLPLVVSNDCFLTTAACDMLGLPDDCWELTSLRRLRDQHLRATAQGRAMIDAYYREAPAIAERLTHSAGGRRRLIGIYWCTVLPCAVLMHLGAPRLAVRLYAASFARLKEDAARSPRDLEPVGQQNP